MSNIVLDHKLATIFFEFMYAYKQPHDSTLYKLFQFIQPFYVPSEYIADVFADHKLPQQLLTAALATKALWVIFDNPSKYTGVKLEQAMLDASKLRIKLTTTPSLSSGRYCEINIADKSEQFTLNYTMKYKARENRNRAINHIRSLLKSAKTIISIRDRFLKVHYINDLVSLLSGLNVASIHMYTDKNEKDEIANILKKNKIATIPHSYDAKTMHDRYIQIDDKLEITLSSGFEGLFCADKDFSYNLRLL